MTNSERLSFAIGVAIIGALALVYVVALALQTACQVRRRSSRDPQEVESR